MKYLMCISLIFLLFSSTSALASVSLEQVLRLTKNYGYRSSQVDWPKTEREARLVYASQGEDAAINTVLAALGDPHTRYDPLNQTEGMPKFPSTQTSAPIAELFSHLSDYPLLQINRWSGSNANQAASLVRSTLEQARSVESCGIILDFTQNSGGNMWPMLVGLAPLLTDGKLGSFKTAAGKVKLIEKRDGQIMFDGAAHALNASVQSANLTNPSYIAILIGPESASSGEITPLMFYGQPNVRFFGKQSAGFTSANTVYSLPNGGQLVLTTSMSLNRNDEAFTSGIAPDELSDQPFQAASRWLKIECSGIFRSVQN